MLSFPLNSSTPVFYVNKDAYRKAGLDPEKAPKTWRDFGSPAINLVPARRSGSGVSVGEGLVIALSDGLADVAPQDVTLGVRPEHFVVTPAASGRGAASARAVDSDVSIAQTRAGEARKFLCTRQVPRR
jgi:ABC-type sugar transport system ATPase subunit